MRERERERIKERMREYERERERERENERAGLYFEWPSKSTKTKWAMAIVF